MIELNVHRLLDGSENGCIVRADEPVRVDIGLDPLGNLHVMVYTGPEDNLEQDIVGAYDGTLERNTGWKVDVAKRLADMSEEELRQLDGGKLQ